MLNNTTVIIPVHNQWEMTKNCLQSLAFHQINAEVVVIDNGSSDETNAGCEPFGRSLFGDKFTCLRVEQNMNFGPACNLGGKHGSGDYLFFLNNDTILTQDCFLSLLKAFQEIPNLGAVGPVLLYPDSNRVQHLGIVFDPGGNVEHLYEFFPGNHPVVRKRRYFQAITGAAMMIPRNLFFACGGFHETYRNGFEDVDLGFTLGAKGYRLTCEPQSRIYHLVGQSAGRFDQEEHNKAILQQRWGRTFSPDLHTIAQADGYAMRVTPWLETFLALPQPKASEFRSRLGETPDPGACFNLLQEEPLWEQGYELLGALLERHGLWPEAVEVRFWQSQFCPSMAAVSSLRDAAAKAGRTDIAEQAVARLAGIRRRLADKAAAEAFLSRVKHDLQAWGLDELFQVYADAAGGTAAFTGNVMLDEKAKRSQN